MGGGVGGSLRACATSVGAWMGVGVGVWTCVGDTRLGVDAGDAVGVWIGCVRFCVVFVVI